MSEAPAPPTSMLKNVAVKLGNQSGCFFMKGRRHLFQPTTLILGVGESCFCFVAFKLDGCFFLKNPLAEDRFLHSSAIPLSKKPVFFCCCDEDAAPQNVFCKFAPNRSPKVFSFKQTGCFLEFWVFLVFFLAMVFC